MFLCMMSGPAMWLCPTRRRIWAKAWLLQSANKPGFEEKQVRYPVAIEIGDENTAFGVVFPDLPGCFSAGDTLDEALTNAEESAAVWIDSVLDKGGAVPAPSSLDALRENPDFAGWTFAVVTVDPALLDDTAERVNITLPRRVLKRLDALADAAGATRSGFIAQMTIEDRRAA
jgi:predicted RNase H-like HicB family nuclease